MDETISLLPFIESGGNGFLLDIPVSGLDRDSFRGYSYPFQIADKGQNFSILVKAGIKIKGADRFKSLFLLVQRDDYPLCPDGLAIFTNTSIDRIWYETIKSYSMDNNVFSVPEQIGLKGKAIPFSPLFYCKKQERFFHPPCPECGSNLVLCREDGLLINRSLPPFSTSLKRYLYCPRCHAASTSDEFYQFSRAADDPVFTKDRFELIKDFHKLRTSVSGSFPCPSCSGHAECYITGEKAASCISFFSFYPFHMLFFDAEPVKAVDFLPLIGGASFKEINTLKSAISDFEWEKIINSQRPLFFFKGEKRFFLEVLYLKLSFFEEFSRALFQRFEKNTGIRVHLSARSIWIRPQSAGSSLPFFWNFKLSIIDLMVNSSENLIESDLTKNIHLNFIAALWFYTFLVNKNQNQDKVYEIIGKLVNNDSMTRLVSDYRLLTGQFPLAAAQNIFWNPDNQSVSPDYQPFWLMIFKAGLDLFESGKNQSLEGDLNRLIDKIQTMKQKIKEELFSQQKQETVLVQKTPEPDTSRVLSSSEKQSLLLILNGLKTKWAASEEIFPDTDPDMEEDVLETIVLSSPDMESSSNFDNTIEKTMILPGQKTELEDDCGFDDMEETIIISSDKKTLQESDFFSEEDDLDKTIVIDPKK